MNQKELKKIWFRIVCLWDDAPRFVIVRVRLCAHWFLTVAADFCTLWILSVGLWADAPRIFLVSA
jgi:hypothetical protein